MFEGGCDGPVIACLDVVSRRFSWLNFDARKSRRTGQRLPELGRRLVARAGVLGQGPCDHCIDCWRQPWIESRGARRRLVQHLHRHCQHVAAERPLARQQLEQHDAGGVEVGSRICCLAADLFGRHVAWRAQYQAGSSLLCRLDAGDAEITQLQAAGARDEDVGRLDVAMNNALVVRVGQGIKQFANQAQTILGREDKALIKILLQLLAIDEFHHQVAGAGFFAVIEQADDMGMVELARRTGFDQKAASLFGGLIVSKVQTADRLDRNTAFDDAVHALVDEPHSTLTEGADDLVFAELGRQVAHPGKDTG